MLNDYQIITLSLSWADLVIVFLLGLFIWAHFFWQLYGCINYKTLFYTFILILAMLKNL